MENTSILIFQVYCIMIYYNGINGTNLVNISDRTIVNINNVGTFFSYLFSKISYNVLIIIQSGTKTTRVYYFTNIAKRDTL